MHHHSRDHSEAHQAKKGVVELQEVVEALHSLVVLEGFEDFKESGNAEESVESWESEQAEQRVVVVASLGLAVELVFNQVGWDARQEVDQEPGLRVFQNHFLLRSLELSIVFEVRTEHVDQQVDEEQEVH